jgi:2,4-dienoyl-CoA reductase-like NADH-dependent reductase (Old Yellow Enzyme family)
LSETDVKEVVSAHGESAKLAVQAGVDVIETHSAHGYLLSEFLSPITNRWTDAYGGSFQNRIRMLVEVIKAVRENVPEGVPLFSRMSATEWVEESGIGRELSSWDVQSILRLARMLLGLGVDLPDVSSGKQRRNKMRKGNGRCGFCG